MSRKLLMSNSLFDDGGIIKKNLIFHLDATNNTRTGQSSSIVSWHDLSGNNYDLKGSFTVNDKNITLKSEGTLTLAKVIDLSKCTIELRCKPLYSFTILLGITTSTGSSFVQFPQFMASTTAKLLGANIGTFGTSSLVSNFYTYTITFDKGEYVGYLDGVKKFSGTKTSGTTPYEWSSFTLYNGYYSSIRIYNDVLSESDVLSNYNNDIKIYS